MADNPTAKDGVSPEAFERVRRDLEKAQAELAEKNSLVEQANVALSDISLRDNLRAHYKGKVDDPDWAADMLLPHVKGVEADALEAKLAEPQFARLVEVGKSSTPGADDGNVNVPVDPGTLPGYARPSPGSTGEQVAEPKLTVRSPEVREMISRNDRAGLEALVKTGRLTSLSGSTFNQE